MSVEHVDIHDSTASTAGRYALFKTMLKPFTMEACIWGVHPFQISFLIQQPGRFKAGNGRCDEVARSYE